MKTLTALLIVSLARCFGQQSFDKKFTVNISPIDSSQVSFPFPDQAKRDSITHKYSNWHERSRALEKYLLRLENPGISRDNNDIVEVKLLNGKTIKLILNQDSDEKDYCFEHYFKSMKLLVFRVQWGEGNNYAIIDLTNGKKTYLNGWR